MIAAYRLAFTDSILAAFRPRGAEGRWNNRGVVLVYAAEHPALAALEMLTAWDDYQDLKNYHLHCSSFSEDAVADALSDVLAGRVDIRDVDATREYGDAWVESQRVALRVPSVVAPVSYDYLLNPDHPDFEKVVSRERLGAFEFDERILDLISRAKERGGG